MHTIIGFICISLSMQAAGAAVEVPTPQVQPRSPARAAFLSAWGALTQLTGGTPLRGGPAAAVTDAAVIAAPVEADGGDSATLSCNAADSAAREIPAADGVSASRAAASAAGTAVAATAAALGSTESSSDKASKDPEAAPTQADNATPAALSCSNTDLAKSVAQHVSVAGAVATDTGGARVAVPAGADRSTPAALSCSNRVAADSAAQHISVAGAVAADTGGAQVAVPAGADSGIAAALSCSNQVPANSADQPSPAAGGQEAAATSTPISEASSGDEAGSANQGASLVSQGPEFAHVDASVEAGAMLAAPDFGGAAESRHSSAETGAAPLTAAAEAGPAADSSAAVTPKKKTSVAADKHVAVSATAPATSLEEQATEGASASAAASQESTSKPAADTASSSSMRHSPVTVVVAQHISLAHAEIQKDALATAFSSTSGTKGSGQERVPAEDGPASVHPEGLQQLQAAMAVPKAATSPPGCMQVLIKPPMRNYVQAWQQNCREKLTPLVGVPTCLWVSQPRTCL